MNRLIHHFEYKKMAVGISKTQNAYTFFVIDKNVTWHAQILFDNIENVKIAAKEYVDNILSNR